MRNWQNEDLDQAPDPAVARATDQRTGGSHGLRDEGLLESALAPPFQEFASFSPYLTVQQKAARLGYCLVMDHPFIDGNKRIGAHAMLTLLALNGIEIFCTQKYWMWLAGKAGYDGLLKWLLDHQE